MNNVISLVDDSAVAGRDEARRERGCSAWIKPARENLQEFLPAVVCEQRPDARERAWVALLERQRLDRDGSCERQRRFISGLCRIDGSRESCHHGKAHRQLNCDSKIDQFVHTI